MSRSPSSKTAYQWKRKLSAARKSSAFLRVQTPEPTKDSIEIKLPAAGLRLEGTAKQPTL
ncbi:MAG: hypothetical protein NTV29_16950 [Planctomycetota bacterium]|nr:hypothetical protein [Planctomycetota bacterium]